MAVLMTAVPAFAIEVYNNGTDTKVEINGSIRGYMGYGYGENPTATSPNAVKDGMIMGLQTNSRVGVQFQVGKFSGQFEIGARERTMINEPMSYAGVRHAWGAYTTDGGHMFKVGKTSTLTSSVGYLSDVFHTDGSLNGYGGGIIMSRRFMVQYSPGGILKGLSVQLIEDDTNAQMAGVGSLAEDNATVLYNQEFIPRIVISYDKKYDDLMYKVAFSYTAVNGMNATADTDGRNKWATAHVFGIIGAAKASLLDKKVHLAAYTRIGLNEDLYGESMNRMYKGGDTHTGSFSFMTSGNVALPLTATATANADGSVNNIFRAAATVEAGYNFTKKISVIAGVGYQGTWSDVSMSNVATLGKVYLVNSYAAFLQMRYNLNKYIMFTPQIAYYGNSVTLDKADGTGKEEIFHHGLVLVAQMRFTF